MAQEDLTPEFMEEVERVKAMLPKKAWAIIEAYITALTSLPGVVKTSSDLLYCDETFIVESAARKKREQLTHCKRGHPMTDGHPNLIISHLQDGRTVRNCRACTRMRNREARARAGKDKVAEYQREWRKNKQTPRTIFQRAEEKRQRDAELERRKMAQLQKDVD